MDFTQEQISLIFDEIANQKNGYQNQSILKLSLEAIMRAERKQFNLIGSTSFLMGKGLVYHDKTG